VASAPPREASRSGSRPANVLRMFSSSPTETRRAPRRRDASPPRGTPRRTRGGRSRPGPCLNAGRSARRERSRPCAHGRTGNRTRREAPTREKNSRVGRQKSRPTTHRTPQALRTRERVQRRGSRAASRRAPPRLGARAGGTDTCARGTKTRWRARRRTTRARPRRGRGREGRAGRRTRPRVQTRRGRSGGARGARRRRPSPRGGVARRRRRGREPRRRRSRRIACRTWAWLRRRRCDERRRCSPAFSRGRFLYHLRDVFEFQKTRSKRPRLARSGPDAHACDAPACRHAAADARPRTRPPRARRQTPPSRAVSVSS